MKQELILKEVYKNDVGLDVISLGNCRLDFEAEFVFLGFTKTGKLKLGDIVSAGPSVDDFKWVNCFGFVEDTDFGFKVWTKGYNYSKKFEVRK